MGFFDLPSPLFALLDNAMGFLPGALRLAVWALLSAIATMWLYRIFSKQDELAELKPEIKAVQKKMASYDGPLEGLWPLIGKSMRLSGRQMALTLWPAVIGSLPILFVLVFLSNAYGYRPPETGEIVRVTPHRATAPATWRWSEFMAAHFEQDGPAWKIAWPGRPATLTAPGYGTILTLPLDEITGVIHKRQWWNWLIGNPAGYLPDDAPVAAIRFDLEHQRYLPFGPDWLGRWEVIYLALLVLFSMGIKFAWKIH